jgi:hypothetical protein
MPLTLFALWGREEKGKEGKTDPLGTPDLKKSLPEREELERLREDKKYPPKYFLED